VVQLSPTGAGKDRVLSPSRRRTAQILVFLMFVASVALLLNAFAFKQRLEAIRSASSDNGGWVVAQLEVDQKGLMGVLDDAAFALQSGDATTLDARTLALINQEFDIFYSRVDIFSSTLRRMRLSDNTERQITRLQDTRDALTAQIDALTATDTEALMAFREAVNAAHPLVRDITVSALQDITLETARTREEEERLFVRFFVQSLILLGLMGLGTYLVIRLWRELETRTAETGRIAAMLSTAFNSTLNAVIVTDTRSRILYTNEMAQRLLGYHNDRLKHMTLDDVLVLDAAEAGNDGETGRLNLVGKGPVSSACRCADGRTVPVEVSLVRDQDVTGQTIVIGFIRDISRQVAAETDLRAALRTAQQAAQAKSMFLATMSHEMRTPLHGLMASLGLIEESRLSDANRALLKTARDCSARALMQVDDVLELTRLGESRETPEEFRPASIAADIVDELQPLARKSDNRIELVTEGPFDLYRVEGLPIAFARALYNLAGNAVKFTRAGRISIRLRLEGEAPDGLRLSVEVEDTGIGISLADQKRIFENFETADRSETSSSTGSGLGLPIAKLAVERQGGRLGLDSAPGVGSRFHFTIPLHPARRPADPAPQPSAPMPRTRGSAKQVLVVDDNEVNLTLMAEMVRRMGHAPDIARHGQEAVEKAAERAYDVILMDFSMPVLDGPAAAQAIRAGQGASTEAVIIGVTALIEATAGTAGAAAMDDVLTKPVSREQLDEAIRMTRHAAAGGDGADGAARGPAPDAMPQTGAGTAETADAAAALEQLSGLVGQDTALRLTQATLDDAGRAMAALRSRAVTQAEQADIVHKAVGSAGLMGFADLSETLCEIETLLRAGRDPAGTDLPGTLAALLAEMRANYEPLLPAVAGDAQRPG
jgi:PAS domain S-box-containing protein